MIDLERVAAACGGTLTDPRVLDLGAVTIDGRFGRTEAPWLTTGAGGLRLTPARIDALVAALTEIARQQEAGR